MRGFPPVQIFVVTLLFALIAVPLTRLTTAGVQAPSAGLKPKQESSTRVRVVLRYAHPPSELSLQFEGRELPIGSLATSPIELQYELPLQESGIELGLSARWPKGTPSTALSLTLEPRGLESRTQTFWSEDGQLEETLNSQW